MIKRGEFERCPQRTTQILLPIVTAILLLSVTAPAWSVEQKTFSTPEQAASALIKAAQDGNSDELLSIFGDGGKELVFSGDAVQDRSGQKSFVEAYKRKHSLLKQDPKTIVMVVGANDWPLPIPIVNDGGTWRFDTAAGKQELVYRRIGQNELGAIAVCRGYIAAQKDYANAGHDGLPAGLYAQKLMSTPGKQDGLYWETKENEPTSPAGPLLAEADSGGYNTTTAGTKAEPYHGYLFRVLKAQGPAAEGGAKSYLVDGNLSAGVALVAFPAQYRVSGVMTFLVNQDGVVFQKDLGSKTSALAEAMTAYNPDSTWKKVPDNQ